MPHDPRSGATVAEIGVLTVAEVAASLRVSAMTIYRLIHQGDLPALRIGRSYRVPEAAVRAYLDAAHVAAG